MRKLHSFVLFILSSILLLGFSSNNTAKAQSETVNWLTIEEAEAKAKKDPSKKIIIDIYTNWCGFCKKMDKITFPNPKIAKYINEHYFAVKLNAETSRTVIFKGDTLVKTGRTHPIVGIVTNNQLTGYPTIAFLDGELNVIQPISSYLTPEQLDPILHYFAENAYKRVPYNDFIEKDYNKRAK